MFKVGSQLFTAEGPGLVREIVNAGERVFLDLKFHDIPNTVAESARAATRLGVSIFNVHALGGPEMLKTAANAVAGHGPLWTGRPAVIGVTVLTSMNQEILLQTGIGSNMNEQ